MAEVSGMTGAGRLWRAIADLMAERRRPGLPPLPAGLVEAAICPTSGLPAGPDCPNVRRELFLPGTLSDERCRHFEMDFEGGPGLSAGSPPVIGQPRNFSFISPVDGARLAWDPDLPRDHQKIQAVVQSVPEVDEVAVYLDGVELVRRNVSGLRRVQAMADFSPGRRRLSLTAVGFNDGRPVRRASAFVDVE
jgi:hypothetical protein